MSLLGTSGAMATEYACPPVSTIQSSGAIPGGWSVRRLQSPGSLRVVAVMLYAGDPDRKQSLVPDEGPDTAEGSSASWSVYPERGPFWLACHYPGTAAFLARELPKGTAICEVDYGPHDVVRKISCR